MNPTIERPVIVTDEVMEWIDNLRESGKTNMFGARPYIKRKFKCTDDEAGEMLSYWMKTFSARQPK